MAKKKDNIEEKKTKISNVKRKKDEKVAPVVDNNEPKVKVAPIKKTIKTEKPKTVKEIVSAEKVEQKQDIKADVTAQEPVAPKKEINIPTHIGGVRLSDRLINLLRRQAEKR